MSALARLSEISRERGCQRTKLPSLRMPSRQTQSSMAARLSCSPPEVLRSTISNTDLASITPRAGMSS
eukprot:7780096-Lingulodinium_polyedra.AAC.1